MALGWGKRSNFIELQLQSQFQRFFIPNFVCVNISNRIFIMLPGSCPKGGNWGAVAVKNFSVGICDGALSFARSSFC